MWWGGYWRWLQRIWIRRGRRGVCQRTHALLPDLVLARRLDDVAVIGRGMGLKVMASVGLRAIAEHLDVQHTTARTWWRCFQSGSPALVAQCSAVAVALDGTPVMLATSGERALLDALQVAWQRVHVRFGESVGEPPADYRRPGHQPWLTRFDTAHCRGQRNPPIGGQDAEGGHDAAE